jgi:DNA repair exonuclease SbcCD ATPase subunit
MEETPPPSPLFGQHENEKENFDASISFNNLSIGDPLTTAGRSSNVPFSMLSFMEDEMRIFAEEECKCERFEATMKEYLALREKIDNTKSARKVGNEEAEIKRLQNVLAEIKRLQNELAELKEENELCKKVAEHAKKDFNDFHFALDEEKKRSKNRIADLQKENYALSDEVDNLKSLMSKTLEMKEELICLREKLVMFDKVVQRGTLIEEYCKRKKSEYVQLQSAFAAKEAENVQLRNALAAKEAQNQVDAQTVDDAKEVENVELKNVLAAKEAEVLELRKTVTAKEVENVYLQNAFAVKEAENIEFRNALAAKEAEMYNVVVAKEIEFQEFKEAMEKEKEEELNELRHTREKLMKDIEKLNSELDAYDENQRQSSEEIFKLSAKLAQIKAASGDNNSGSPIRAAIDLGENARRSFNDADFSQNSSM